MFVTLFPDNLTFYNLIYFSNCNSFTVQYNRDYPEYWGPGKAVPILKIRIIEVAQYIYIRDIDNLVSDLCSIDKVISSLIFVF